MNIPIIDIQAVFFSNSADKQNIAYEIDKACRESGFFLITGHGISKKFLELFYGSLQQFFDLSLKEKLKYNVKKNKSFSFKDTCPYGYSVLASENAYAFMGEKGDNDFVEKISTGPEILNNYPLACLPSADTCPDLQLVLKESYSLFQKLGMMLSKLFAIAIDLPEDFFINKMNQSYDSFRCNAYPSLKLANNNNGFAPHTDMGLLTIVSQNCNGLEILDANKEWKLIQAPSLDTFVINIGDLMMRWSNDEWISTKHRVLLNEQPRLSTAFFKVINQNEIVKCFPKFCKDKPKNYSSIVYTEFATQKMNKLFNL